MIELPFGADRRALLLTGFELKTLEVALRSDLYPDRYHDLLFPVDHLVAEVDMVAVVDRSLTS